MAQCSVCGTEVGLASGYECNFCHRTHCSDHRLPENHYCAGPGSGRSRNVTDDEATEEAFENLSSSAHTTVGEDTESGGGLIQWVYLLVFFAAIIGVLAGIVVAGSALIGPAGSVVDGISEGVDDIAAGIDSAQSGPDPLSTHRAEQLIHQEVNERRSAHGVPNVTWSDPLASEAFDHSYDMEERDYYAHTSPEGVTFQERFSMNCRAGENIMRTLWREDVTVQGDTERITSEEQLAEHVVDAWMGSEGHRENLLNPNFSVEGIAVVSDGREIHVTQILCGA